MLLVRRHVGYAFLKPTFHNVLPVCWIAPRAWKTGLFRRAWVLFDPVAASLPLPLITVRAQFIGATTWPHEFAATFLASVENIVTTFPRTETAAQVDALRFLYQHPMDSPIDRDFFDEIDRFAETYPDSPAVISLYTAASEELMRNGQDHSAGALLRRGIQAYQDRPGLNQLIKALVDQGHVPPPAPLLTEKTLAALTGATATKKRLNRRPQSSLPSFYGGFKPRGMLPGHGLNHTR